MLLNVVSHLWSITDQTHGNMESILVEWKLIAKAEMICEIYKS